MVLLTKEIRLDEEIFIYPEIVNNIPSRLSTVRLYSTHESYNLLFIQCMYIHLIYNLKILQLLASN